MGIWGSVWPCSNGNVVMVVMVVMVDQYTSPVVVKAKRVAETPSTMVAQAVAEAAPPT